MAILPVLTHPDPVLKQIAAPVEALDDRLRALVEDMAETMYREDGIGLAAPQVGESIRLIVCDPVAAEEQGKNLLVLYNPEIVASEDSIDWEEGCLSVPDVRATVKRAGRVVIRARDRDFDLIEIQAEGLAAVCLQHEIDHLDGKLFFERLSSLKRRLLLREYRNMMAAED
jgi:peptide deformylase